MSNRPSAGWWPRANAPDPPAYRFAARGQLAHTPSPYAPVVDGTVLPHHPWRALAAGASRDIALAAGHTPDEYRLVITLAGQLGKVTEAQAGRPLRIFAPYGALTPVGVGH